MSVQRFVSLREFTEGVQRLSSLVPESRRAEAFDLLGEIVGFTEDRQAGRLAAKLRREGLRRAASLIDPESIEG